MPRVSTRVSVVIPVYNAQDVIRETIESVLAQTWTHYDLIVVDDGSIDGSEAIVREFGDRIRYMRQKNSGVACARNRGIAESTGEYVTLLDHDDLWHPTKLEKQVAVLDGRPEVGMVVELWTRIAARYEIANIPEPLTYHRDRDIKPAAIALGHRPLLIETLLVRVGNDPDKRRYLLQEQASYLADRGKQLVGMGERTQGWACLVQGLALSIKEARSWKTAWRCLSRLVRSYV